MSRRVRHQVALAMLAVFAVLLLILPLLALAEGTVEVTTPEAPTCPPGQAWLELNVGPDVYRLACYAWEQLQREQISARLGGQPVVLRVLVVRTPTPMPFPQKEKRP